MTGIAQARRTPLATGLPLINGSTTLRGNVDLDQEGRVRACYREEWLRSQRASNESRRLRVLIGVRGKYEKECRSLPHRAAARRRILSRGYGRSNHFRQALLAERSTRLAWPDP